jgi:PIN domain nuclease of toxin-antitoxin system
VRLLLDTHVFLWAVSAPDELTPEVREAIEDEGNEVLVSSAVGWEIAIKYAAAKLVLPEEPFTWLPTRLAALGFRELPIDIRHALHAGALPHIHDDPFDRMMIAQARTEGLTFVTRDRKNQRYSVALLHA